MTGKMFCTTCKESTKSNQMATIGTTNFRQSTLDRHGRENHSTVEAKVLHHSMMQATEKATSDKEKPILSAMRTMYFVIKICKFAITAKWLSFYETPLLKSCIHLCYGNTESCLHFYKNSPESCPRPYKTDKILYKILLGS